MDHVPFGDTPASRCHYYRRVCDLPAHIDPPHLGRIVMAWGKNAGRGAWASVLRFNYMALLYVGVADNLLGGVSNRSDAVRTIVLVTPESHVIESISSGSAGSVAQ